MKECGKCKLEKPFDSFSFRSRAKGTRSAWCKSCHKDADSDRYHTDGYKEAKRIRHAALRVSNRKFVIEFLKTKCCVDCGEKRLPCLQFDHQKGFSKVCNVSNMMHYTIEALKAEIAKCVVRCANCHAMKTSVDQGWYGDRADVSQTGR